MPSFRYVRLENSSSNEPIADGNSWTATRGWPRLSLVVDQLLSGTNAGSPFQKGPYLGYSLPHRTSTTEGQEPPSGEGEKMEDPKTT